jgi:hypothetical protein
MFDTYYYIRKIPASIPRDTPIHVTGGRFHAVPGVYELPNGDGFYTVSGLGFSHPARITMNTRGSCECYEHDFLDYIGPTIEYDAGWYRWFSDSTTAGYYS